MMGDDTGMIPAKHAIFQMSWVVTDLEAAARRWHAATGIGPFLINRHIKITDPMHRGKPRAVDFSTALAQAGEVQIELVQQHEDGPSCYRDTVPAGTEAMHHVAIMPDDYDAAVQSYLDQGFAVASSGLFGDVRFCYIDCSSATGCMMEIIEDSPGIRAFFGAVRRAAERWDGDAATLLREV